MTSTEILPSSHACVGIPSHFDYNALGPEAADEARAAADRIRKLGYQQNEAIFAIGHELIAIRAKLSGQWVSWLRAEFDMSVSTAERYISVAGKLPEKIVTVTNLRPTTLYSLSANSTSAPVREEVITRIENGEALSDKEIRDLVAQGKAAGKPPERGEEQVEAGRSKKASNDAIRRAQQAVVSMLFEAFRGSRIEELVLHLVEAGWGDASAKDGLICAINHRCQAVMPVGNTVTGEPTADREGPGSTDAALADVGGVVPEIQSGVEPNASAVPAPTSDMENGAQGDDQAAPISLSTDDRAVGTATAGENGPSAQGPLAHAGQATDGGGESIAPGTAAPSTPFTLARPSETMPIVEEPPGGPTGGDPSVADAGEVADSNGKPPVPAIITATSPASAANEGFGAPSPLAPRFGKVWPDCMAPRGTCRYGGCRPGQGGCKAPSTVVLQAA